MVEMDYHLFSKIVLDRMRCFAPIGAYRDEFASVKTENPRQQIEAMALLGGHLQVKPA